MRRTRGPVRPRDVSAEGARASAVQRGEGTAGLLASRVPSDSELVQMNVVSARPSHPSHPLPEDGLRARVLPQADRASRIASMLDRWASEAVEDEPDWDVDDLVPLALRSPPTP